MDFEHFKYCIKEALKDKEIRKIIKEISVEEDKKNKPLFLIGDEKIKKLKEENKNLNNENEELKEQIEELKSYCQNIKLNYKNLKDKNESLEESLNNYEKKETYLNNLLEEKKKNIKSLEDDNKFFKEKLESYQAEIESMRKNVKYYENTYMELEKYFRIYNKLPINIKTDLERVIKDDNAEMFLSSGVQRDNLDALWDYISYSLNILSKEEIQNLIKVFEYLFNTYNKFSNSLEFDDVNVNDEFDDEYHTRGKGSMVSGRISKIQLRGYRYLNNKKIIKKSIVII